MSVIRGRKGEDTFNATKMEGLVILKGGGSGKNLGFDLPYWYEGTYLSH